MIAALLHDGPEDQGGRVTLEEIRRRFGDEVARIVAECTDTLEFTYRTAEGTLVGVGICDRTPSALSSLYFYSEPELSARGLGTYSSLYEIEYARTSSLPYYYLGYWIADCAKMAYKNRFRPYELLGLDGVWRLVEEKAHDRD